MPTRALPATMAWPSSSSVRTVRTTRNEVEFSKRWINSRLSWLLAWSQMTVLMLRMLVSMA